MRCRQIAGGLDRRAQTGAKPLAAASKPGVAAGVDQTSKRSCEAGSAFVPPADTQAVPITVCIADDHLLVLGIRAALESADDIEIVGTTHSGATVLTLVEEHRPDVLLLEHVIADVGGLTCVKLVVERFPETKVVMISGSEEPARIRAALEAGASAYVGKRIRAADLASALRQVVTGIVHYREATLVADPPTCAADRLTQRERTLLEAVARGLTTKVISRELWISEKTVKFHLTNIYRKLGVHNRTGAMRYAFDHQLIGPPAQGDTALSA